MAAAAAAACAPWELAARTLEESGLHCPPTCVWPSGGNRPSPERARAAAVWLLRQCSDCLLGANTFFLAKSLLERTLVVDPAWSEHKLAATLAACLVLASKTCEVAPVRLRDLKTATLTVDAMRTAERHVLNTLGMDLRFRHLAPAYLEALVAAGVLTPAEERRALRLALAVAVSQPAAEVLHTVAACAAIAKDTAGGAHAACAALGVALEDAAPIAIAACEHHANPSLHAVVDLFLRRSLRWPSEAQPSTAPTPWARATEAPPRSAPSYLAALLRRLRE